MLLILDRETIMRAFASEADSNTRMSIYAEKAREEGFNAIGDTFEEISGNDERIAGVWLERAGEIGSIEENLQKGIDSNKQQLEFYQGIQDEENEAVITAITQVKENQIDMLQEALDGLDTETWYTPGTSSHWLCSRCGFVAGGNRCPLSCPLCRCHQGFFRPHRPGRRPTPPPPPPPHPGQRPRYGGRR